MSTDTSHPSDGLNVVPSEVIEQHERALADLLGGEDPSEVYVAGTPETEADMIAGFDAETVGQGIVSSSNEHRIKLLEEELLATRDQIRKMAMNAGGLNVEQVGRETTELEEDRRWEATYQKVRRAGGYCTIILHASEDPQRNQQISVGVNGHTIYLPRNVPVKVHVSVLEILVRSRVNSVAPFLNERGERTWGPIRYQCYPFSLLDQGVPVKGRRGQLMMAA